MFEVCDVPVRAAKFVPRKNWIITGSVEYSVFKKSTCQYLNYTFFYLFSVFQDDMQIRVFNYNTLERVHIFEAHSDYVRSIVVHPSQPFILTSSGKSCFVLGRRHFHHSTLWIIINFFYNAIDDMLIKLWNWDKQWTCQQVFEGHAHYVMQIVINPKDNNTFASASLDRTVKVSRMYLCASLIKCTSVM